MKRILIALSIVMAFFKVQAQPAAGQLFAGGDLGVNHSSFKFKSGGTTSVNQTVTSLSILPMAGYFLSDNLAVGALIGITSSIRKFPDDDPEKSTSFQFHFRPFGRYYLISGTGGIFAEASVGIGTGKSKVFFDAGTQESNLTSFDVGISPGVYYFITPKLAFEAGFGWFGFFTEVEKDGDQKDISNDFGFNLYTSGISLGFIYVL